MRTQLPHRSWQALLALAALAGLWSAAGGAGQRLTIRQLEVQEFRGGTYFLVRLAKPDAMAAGESRQARLVPQDGLTWAIYPVAGDSETITFVGKVREPGKAKFVLHYPSVEEIPDPGSAREQKVLQKPTWTETPLTLDLGKAMRPPYPMPKRFDERDVTEQSDFQDRWAMAQAREFLRLADQNGDFGFFRFAARATARKHGIRLSEAGASRHNGRGDPTFVDRQLYETTTGVAAIAESLQTRRMLNRAQAPEPRTIDVAKVPGIDIAEHPWTEMMGDKKPSPEPLARLVPRDNYYIHFKSMRKFIEFGELMDDWGTNIARAYEFSSRDYQLKERYEKQLCLRSTWLGKTLGDKLIRGVAITGNDPYLREGSDVTVIFQVKDRNLFLAAVDPFIEAAKKEFGNQLQESQYIHGGFVVQKVATPLREVCLHRTSFGDFVLYSNSPVAIRRCLDAYQGRAKAIADALDYQYMRTVFRREDAEEDGFAFLSDAFIRQLVGPASKIKEKRRLEALTSLYLATHGALFTAWETGKPPGDLERLQREARIRTDELVLPEGGTLTWDSSQEAAVSDVYNTIHFATPLVELPIEKITPSEEREYRQFREQYLGLWRRYFDPVGMRVQLTDKQVRLETYILPLIRSSQYNSLRMWTGDGTHSIHPGWFTAGALAQYTTHLAASQRADGIGDWFFIRLDDGAIYQQLADYWVRTAVHGNQFSSENQQEALRLLVNMPLTIGVGVKDQKVFLEQLEKLRNLADAFIGPCHVDRNFATHRGIAITQVAFKDDSRLVREHLPKPAADGKPWHPALYHAFVDDAWLVSFQEKSLVAAIDQFLALRDGKPAPPEEVVKVNNSLYLAPKAAHQARAALRYYLEWEMQRRALQNEAILYPLYRAGLVAADAPETDLRAKALKWYGFIPVSPDGAAYVFDVKNDEIANKRHGTVRNPLVHAGPADGSPTALLLEQLQTIRADLRFREDGVQTVLTIERKAK